MAGGKFVGNADMGQRACKAYLGFHTACLCQSLPLVAVPMRVNCAFTPEPGGVAMIPTRRNRLMQQRIDAATSASFSSS